MKRLTLSCADGGGQVGISNRRARPGRELLPPVDAAAPSG